MERTQRFSSIGNQTQKTLFLASNDQTLNFEPNRAFIRFTKLLIEQTRTSFFQTSNKLHHVHLLVIKPYFWFRTIEH